MGLQDRDYMKARHQQRTSQENADLFNKSTYDNFSIRLSTNYSSLKYLFILFVILGVFLYFSNFFLEKIKLSKAPELIPGGLILHADPQGHFRGTVLINNVLMPFMIDTGATDTAIPAKLALAVGLPFGQSFQTSTAGGIVTDQKTHIDSLKLGTAEIKNLEGSINVHLQEVLIGMNTLKYFKMTKTINTLTLVASTKPEEIAAIERSLSVSAPYQAQAPLKRPDYPPSVAPLSSYDTHQPPKTKWKKSVICEGTHCKTLYDQSR